MARLTADQAHAIAINWQENKCSAYVDRALEAIKERAEKGYFTADVLDPHPSNVNKEECIKAMQELGFSIDHIWKDYTRWKW